MRKLTHKDSNGKRRSQQECEFIEEMAKTGDATRSARKSGLRTSAKKKAELLSEDIEKQVRAELGDTASKALKNLISLAFSAESEQVRLKGTMDLLDRAGFKPVDKHQEVKEQRSLAEIDAEIRELVGGDVADMLLGKKKAEQPKAGTKKQSVVLSEAEKAVGGSKDTLLN